MMPLTDDDERDPYDHGELRCITMGEIGPDPPATMTVAGEPAGLRKNA
jgi:hypothetical protein